MTTSAWWGVVGLALVIGAMAGGWATLRFTRPRFERQVQRAVEEAQQRQSSALDQARAAVTRAQTELDQSKTAFKRQLAAVAAEPRAALERAEDRLKAAYAELDRLRGKGSADTGAADLSDGFAATRPMRDGM